MKKNYLFLLLILLFNCSNDENNENCNGNQDLIFENFSINKITIYDSDNTTIWKEYTIDENNRIVQLYDTTSNTSSDYFDYLYNECNQLTKITTSISGETFINNSFEYDSSGNLIKFTAGGYYLVFEYNGNKVICKEYRGPNNTLLNFRAEFTFDNNENLTMSENLSVDDIRLFEFDSNNNNISNDCNLTYHNEKNPLYLINTNTYSRKNSFLINYGFISTGDCQFLENYLIHNGLSPNLTASWEETLSLENDSYSCEIIETQNGQAKSFNILRNGTLVRKVEVEYN